MNPNEISEEEINNMNVEQLQELEKQIGGGSEEEDFSMGAPSPDKKDSQLKLFRDIINTKDSKKVANLGSKELGDVKMGVRHLLEMALYCEVEGIHILAEAFEREAEITLATSMSKKGFLLQTIVTQIQKQMKMKEPSDKVKKTIFGKPKSPGGELQ